MIKFTTAAFVFIMGLLISFLLMSGVAIAKQAIDSERDSYIHNGYLIDKCPANYTAHTFSSGDKYCIEQSKIFAKVELW